MSQGRRCRSEGTDLADAAALSVETAPRPGALLGRREQDDAPRPLLPPARRAQEPQAAERSRWSCRSGYR